MNSPNPNKPRRPHTSSPRRHQHKNSETQSKNLTPVGGSSVGQSACLRHARAGSPRFKSRCCLLTTRLLCQRCAPTRLQLRVTWHSPCSLDLDAPTISPLKSTGWACDKSKWIESTKISPPNPTWIRKKCWCNLKYKTWVIYSHPLKVVTSISSVLVKYGKTIT